MKRNCFIYLITALIVFSSCSSEEKKENTLNFSGAFALYPLVIKWSEEYMKEHEEIRFNISAGGAGKGMADAMAGVVDLGMFSREISDEEKEKGVWWVGLCTDAVLPTISADNPYLPLIKKRGLTRDEFKDVFINGTVKDWGGLLQVKESNNIEVYTRSDACGAAGTWAKYLDAKQEDIKGTGIHGDPALAEAVGKDKYGIAFNNTAFIYDINTGKKRPGIEVIPLDLNADGQIGPEEDFYDSLEKLLVAVSEGVYPSPPARELFFVAKEKPKKKATLDFILWTLTEGQKYVKEAGYVPIKQEKLDVYIKKTGE